MELRLFKEDQGIGSSLDGGDLDPEANVIVLVVTELVDGPAVRLDEAVNVVRVRVVEALRRSDKGIKSWARTSRNQVKRVDERSDRNQNKR